ncbi:MAG TPA: response regulator transcription factor [Thiotrichaceae bacterium]|jgi:DNA-binding NarL/FixJ family response regulator|nr:response regulator transcription factor [Thiotrichaceae bacterium]HIM07957.1 response regulator transcription factor [Gammaproteobacteria bacterium]
MSDKIKVMLVDDHAVVRAGYQMLLKNSPEIEVIAEADSGEEAYRLHALHKPDVIVMDISLPGMGGIEAIKRIHSKDNQTKILVFSMHEEIIFVEQALQAGAKGYITKSTDPQLLVDAIKRLSRGENYIDAELAQRLAYEKSRGQDTPLSDFSTREFEIFCMLAEGLNTSEIAKRLSLSYKTVANYSTQIKNKLDVATVADIARIAIRYNIIQA